MSIWNQLPLHLPAGFVCWHLAGSICHAPFPSGLLCTEEPEIRAPCRPQPCDPVLCVQQHLPVTGRRLGDGALAEQLLNTWILADHGVDLAARGACQHLSWPGRMWGLYEHICCHMLLCCAFLWLYVVISLKRDRPVCCSLETNAFPLLQFLFSKNLTFGMG